METPTLKELKEALKDRGIDIVAVELNHVDNYTAVSKDGCKSEPFLVIEDSACQYDLYIKLPNSGLDVTDDAIFLENEIERF